MYDVAHGDLGKILLHWDSCSLFFPARDFITNVDGFATIPFLFARIGYRHFKFHYAVYFYYMYEFLLAIRVLSLYFLGTGLSTI